MPEHRTVLVAHKAREGVKERAKQIAAKLKPPENAADGNDMKRADFIAFVREQSELDPLYLTKVLDNLAPPAIPGPDGTKLRAELGLDNFLELVKDARPDIYAAVMLAS